MIQAKSLSNVLQLADNPPPSPLISLENEDPLVLYIARVPDVFLTTTKPIQKVVTAHDVQSSLYYIHVDSEHDEQLRRSIESRGPDDLGNQGPILNADRTVQKKPVPTAPNVYIEEQSEGPPLAPYSHRESNHSLCGVVHMARKPVSPRIPPGNEDAHSTSTPTGTHVMGPRAMYSRLQSDANPGLGLSQGKENVIPRRWSEQPQMMQPPLPPKPEAAPSFGHETKSNRPLTDDGSRPSPSNQSTSFYGRPSHQRRSTESGGFSLTMIRRYDGSQWNVGKIVNAYEGESLLQQQPACWQDDLSIRISTPGYLKFHDPKSSPTPVAPDEVFERRLMKLRRRSQDHPSYEKQTDGQNGRKSRMSIDFRRLSKPRLARASVSTGSNPSPESKSPGTKGYGFYSPWNGICEFSSGISGNALKCKHTTSTEGSQTMTVSELRFNLPSSNSLAAVSPQTTRSPQKSRDTKRSSYFSSEGGKDPPLPQLNDQEPKTAEDTSAHFDLSLGQEHAGGGFGGKQAKLGKLIIEPEGLKMLDLLVAANMGLWWKVYEKSA
ncbi:MAG: hypothetical protein Q9208_001714 [Pyrenodesmia sp. 3 TL-2023]